MADELTPGQVRARQFDVVRKGYERGQVEQFLADLSHHIEQLQAELEELSAAGVALGIDEHEALARELHTIGGDVGEILEAARAAAEGIRSRANRDAEEWRTAAEAESTSMVAVALEQTQSVRASAWNEGSSLLSSAGAEAESIVAAAKEEALFLRAEAEREAIRLTGDAKRDREELVRAARSEAEQIIEAARNESDGMLAAANQQAELAQERARALEDRRSELLAELEATRASIGELESEIESRKLELEEPAEPEPIVEELDEELKDPRSHHTHDGGSVKIVAPTRAAPMRPVDAEELVAEVIAMRAGDAVEQAPDAPTLVPDLLEPPEPANGVEDDQPSVPAEDAEALPVVPEVKEVTSGDDDETAELVVAPEPLVAPSEPSDGVPSATDERSTPLPDSTPEAEAREDAAQTEDGVADEVGHRVAADRDLTDEGTRSQDRPSDVEAATDSGADDLGSLFAQLRDTSTPDVVPSVPDEAATAPEEPASEDPAPEPADVPSVSGPSPSDADANAQLIRLQNAALRSIKRILVELQNEALEHLRTDKDWMPDEAFTNRFDDAFEELTLVVTGEIDPRASSAFGTDLYDAVSSAMERSREAGAGDRELAAATSKVFRTWRSDEAERRVADVASPSLS